MSIQFKRGQSDKRKLSNVTLLPGQPFYETDTGKLYIGNGQALKDAASSIPALSQPNEFTETNTFISHDTDTDVKRTTTVAGGSIVVKSVNGTTNQSQVASIGFNVMSVGRQNEEGITTSYASLNSGGVLNIENSDGVITTYAPNLIRREIGDYVETYNLPNNQRKDIEDSLMITSDIKVNPTLFGSEDVLTGIRINGTDYKIESGGGSGDVIAAGNNTFTGINKFVVPESFAATATDDEGFMITSSNRSPGKEYLKLGFNGNSPVIKARDGSRMRDISLLFPVKETGKYTIATLNDLKTAHYINIISNDYQLYLTLIDNDSSTISSVRELITHLSRIVGGSEKCIPASGYYKVGSTIHNLYCVGYNSLELLYAEYMENSISNYLVISSGTSVTEYKI